MEKIIFGTEWVKTQGLVIKGDEIKNVTAVFAQKSNSIPSIVFGGNNFSAFFNFITFMTFYIPFFI